MLKIGFDLDGVFINDLAAEAFNDQNIHHSLRHRQFATPLFSVHSVLEALDATGVLITARPCQDEEDTRMWAKSNGVFLDIIFGKHVNHLWTEKAAEFKAKIIKNLNIDVFIESDQEQGSLIQRACPGVKVLCAPLIIQQALIFSIAKGK